MAKNNASFTPTCLRIWKKSTCSILPSHTCTRFQSYRFLPENPQKKPTLMRPHKFGGICVKGLVFTLWLHYMQLILAFAVVKWWVSWTRNWETKVQLSDQLWTSFSDLGPRSNLPHRCGERGEEESNARLWAPWRRGRIKNVINVSRLSAWWLSTVFNLVDNSHYHQNWVCQRGTNSPNRKKILPIISCKVFPL